MKAYLCVLAVLTISFASLGQDKTPVLSEMGSLQPATETQQEATLSEMDSPASVSNPEKRNRARRLQKKAALAEAKKAEVSDEPEN